MSSIRIHQDIYKFERRRKGFTTRQIVSAVIGLSIMAAFTAIGTYCLGLPYQIGGAVGCVFCFAVIACGFFPVFGMHAEQFLLKWIDIHRRGPVVSYEAQGLEIEKGGNPRVEKKKARRKGYECASNRRK